MSISTCSRALRPAAFPAASMAAALALVAGMARAQERLPYSIHQDEATTGSHIQRAVGFSSLPLDRPYRELTPEQQAQVRGAYEQMGAGDEPPYPLQGLGVLVRPLSRVQQRMGEQGLLVLFIEVDANGDATQVAVMKTPSEEIGKIAAAVAMNTKFKPALCRGQPCAMGFPWRIQLTREL